MMDVPAAAGWAGSAEVTSRPGDGDGRVRLIVRGDLDRHRVLRVRHIVIDELRRHQPVRIEVDLAGCPLIDAAGVRGLQICRAEAFQLNCRLVIVQASAANRRILEAAGLIGHSCAAAVADSIGTPPGPRCHCRSPTLQPEP